MWAVRSASDTCRACVEVYLVTLVLSRPDGSPQLQARGVQLVARTALPPHLVLLAADQAQLLLAIDPQGAFEEDTERTECPMVADASTSAWVLQFVWVH